MLFMVIERYKEGKAEAIYARFHERGRMLPTGLDYVESWVEPDLTRCFQLMQTDDESLLHQWAKHWNDLVDFDFVLVISSYVAAATAGRKPEPH
jgi:hypothetical protein